MGEPPRERHRRLEVFLDDRASVACALLALAIGGLALLPPGWLPRDPTLMNLGEANLPGFWEGGWDHPLGTDFMGRDMLWRLVFATRLTLVIGASALVLTTVSAVALGLVAGYHGGWVDEVISWLIDVQLAFPVMALAVAVVALLGGSVMSLIVVLATTGWSTVARIVRVEAAAARGYDYVLAARALGAPVRSILVRHILPNLVSPLVVAATFVFARFVLTESALSFLGLGISAPDATWGSLVGDGRQYLYQSWWTAAVPGVAIAVLVVVFNLLGDGLRDAFDPHQQCRGGMDH